MEFPYGKAPFYILLIAIVTGVISFATSLRHKVEKPDLVFALFSKEHYEAYREVIPEFEAKHNIKVQFQLVERRALWGRLQAALLAGTAVPDLVEVEEYTMGFFTKGPLEDVGFWDMTEKIKEEGLDKRMVETRFAMYSSRGRIFALPHDVHPVVLVYRRDIIEELGINVDELTTWDKFVEVGRKITQDFDGDGIPDRYMLDTHRDDGTNTLPVLIRQRGTDMFDAAGSCVFDNEIVVDTVIWLIHQIRGENRIGFPCDWGQPLSQAMVSGFVLFYFAPDWRTRVFQLDVPTLSGKLAMMPLPAWEEGGRRTSTWGGTGLGITKYCKDKELAWELAKFLYFRKEDLGKRFKQMNIIPALREAWEMPELDEPSEFYSGQAIGRIFADLAPSTPANYVSPYWETGHTKLIEAFVNSVNYYKKHGDEGLEDFVRGELNRTASYVRKLMSRNRFLNPKSSDN